MTRPGGNSYQRRMVSLARSNRPHAALVAAAIACFTLSAGCRMGVPIHVWSAPKLTSTVGKSVVLPPLEGDRALSDSIRQRLLASATEDAHRSVAILSSEDVKLAAQLSERDSVALASHVENDQSDVTIAAAARTVGADYVLRGEVLPDRIPPLGPENDPRLAVSWQLTPLDGDDTALGVRGHPVVVELKSALQRHPDLAAISEPDAALETALVRETLPLIMPSVRRERISLEIPYFVPGGKAMRRGNALALAGRWPEAEAAWQQVVKRHWYSSVATHNLALAAVARQDFSTAKRLARKAIRMKPTSLHKNTLVWIEQAQREYHQAFGLPDPPEGWFVTHTPEDHTPEDHTPEDHTPEDHTPADRTPEDQRSSPAN